MINKTIFIFLLLEIHEIASDLQVLKDRLKNLGLISLLSIF
jgi:hypothetical protein